MDYYEILGVGRDADKEELKRAYRRLARQCHPDVNPGDSEAEKRFKEINEAYHVLSDPQKRRRYNQLGAVWSHWEQTETGSESFEWGQWISGTPEPQVRRRPRRRADIWVEGEEAPDRPEESDPLAEKSPPPNFFTHLFGGDKPKSKSGVELRFGPDGEMPPQPDQESRPDQASGGGQAPRPDQASGGEQAPRPDQTFDGGQEPWLEEESSFDRDFASDWDAELEKQFWEQEGGQVWIEPELRREWESRRSSSSPASQEQSAPPEPDAEPAKNSAGGAEFGSASSQDEGAKEPSFKAGPVQVAPQRGQDYEQKVQISLRQAYHGATLTLCRAEQRLTIKILPGTRSGVRVPVSGQGGPGIDGGEAGDLYLNIEVLPDPQFERRGDDLYLSAPIDLYTAILGGQIRVPTLGEPVILVIPANTQNGCTFRLRNLGMPRLQQPQEYGDLYIKVAVQLPMDLDPDQIELFRRLQKTA